MLEAMNGKLDFHPYAKKDREQHLVHVAIRKEATEQCRNQIKPENFSVNPRKQFSNIEEHINSKVSDPLELHSPTTGYVLATN